MPHSAYLSVLPLVLALASAENTAARRIAAGWTSPPSGSYQAFIDRKTAHGGRSSLSLKSVSAEAHDYAARQRIRADAYRGKRIRLSGFIRTDRSVEGGALWLRIDMTNGDYILDGMLESNARSWTACELVAEVPADAIGISFGVRLKGPGQIWADDLALSVVGKSVATTSIERRPYRGPGKDAGIAQMRQEYAQAPLRAVNLSFEDP